jgi:hypothetical protein
MVIDLFVNNCTYRAFIRYPLPLLNIHPNRSTTMKHTAIILLSVCGLAASFAQAKGTVTRPTPKYLSVPDFRSCLKTEYQGGSSTHWCLPEKKPQQCLQSSWDALVALHNNGELAPCGDTSQAQVMK